MLRANRLFLGLVALSLAVAGCDTQGGKPGPPVGEIASSSTVEPVDLSALDPDRQVAFVKESHGRIADLLAATHPAESARFRSMRDARPPATAFGDDAVAAANRPALFGAADDTTEGVPERGSWYALASGREQSSDLTATITFEADGEVVHSDSLATQWINGGYDWWEGLMGHGELDAAKGSTVSATIRGEFRGVPVDPVTVRLDRGLHGAYTGEWASVNDVHLRTAGGSGPLVYTVRLELWVWPDVVALDIAPNQVLVEEGDGTGFTVTGVGSDGEPARLPDKTLLDVSVGGDATAPLLWINPETGEEVSFTQGTALALGDINQGHLGYMAGGPGPVARRSDEYADMVGVSAVLSGLPFFSGSGSFAVGAGFYKHVTKPEAVQEFSRKCGGAPPFSNPTIATYSAAFEANARLALKMVEAHVSDPVRRQLDGVTRLASGGAISDIMSAKFRDAEFTLSGDAVGVAKRDIRLLQGQYNRRARWIFAPQHIIVSMAKPENITPIDRTDSVVPYAEARAVEVYHAPLRRVADWVGRIPIPAVNRYAGRHYLVPESISREVLFSWDGRFAPLPRWLSLSSSEFEFTFACTTT